jgi:hypothetical protein
MNKWLKVLLKITGALVLLILILWMGAVGYVSANKKVVLDKITALLNENLNGELTIESMEPVLLKGFPGISVSLKNVTLRDSLWVSHHHDLVKAEEVYISVDAISAIKGSPRIRDISIERGSVYIYTDSTGYTNTSIFAKKTDTTQKKGEVRINKIKMKEVLFVMENKTKFKLFQMNIADMAVNMDYNDKGWEAKIRTNTLVKDLAFNTAKGSFIKNKKLDASIEIAYDKTTKVLDIPTQGIKLDKDKVEIGGKFMLAEKPGSFELNIAAEDIAFKNAASLLTPTIASKLKIVDFKKPLDVEANIKGLMKFRDTPLVVVKWAIKNNTLMTPAGAIEDCSFRGVFQNEVNSALGHNDRNSRITVYEFKGSWETIPFQVDTVFVSNLKSPVIEGRFTSNFPLKKLNSIIGGKSFAFNEGNANLNLHYKGGLSPTDTNKAYVYGAIKVSGANMSYLPRDLKFTNSSAIVNFRGRDVFVQNVRLQGGTTVLQMDGSLLNFLSLYYTDPGKMVLDWRIRSDEINLVEFMSFLGTRKRSAVAAAPKASGAANRMATQLDKLMDASTVHLNCKVGKLTYYSFSAQNIDADVSLQPAGIILNHVYVNHAGGKLAVSGSIGQSGATNNFKVKANVDGVNVQEFFRSFQNFGQDAIMDKNLRGSVFATADVTGSLTDKGKIVPNSLFGFVTFDLKNGMLKDFEPFQKIGKFIFRNRDMSNVSINKLANRLEIQGNKIVINPMYIESSAINLQIDGVYGMDKGTDINIDVPLRNPKKDELILNDSSRQESGMKGIVVHLKATDGADGNVKIKLLAKGDKEKRRKKGKGDEAEEVTN